MLLVLCDTDDVGALWAGLGLRALCPDVEIVSTAELGSALRFELRLDRRGNRDRDHERNNGPDRHGDVVRIDLADGRTISSGDLTGVLNRLRQVPAGQVGQAALSERVYAHAELEALHVSWLAALDCPVINRPRPHGLCGAHRSAIEWALLAAQAGLPVGPDLDHIDRYEDSWLGHQRQPVAATSLVVVDDEVTGKAMPPLLIHGARRLRALSGERVIGITLEPTAEGPRFLGATAMPDFRIGGTAVIEALARSFKPQQSEPRPTGRRLANR